MRFAFGLVCAFLCTGCSGGLAPAYVPIESGFINADAKALYDRLNSMPPGPRLMEGMMIANVRCDQFFEDLDRYETIADFASNRLTNISTALPALLEAGGVSPQAIANTIAAIGFADGWLEDKKTLFLLTEFKSELYNNWQQSRQFAYANNVQIANYIEGLGSSTGDPHLDRALRHSDMAESIANSALYEYSRLCLKSQLKKYIRDHAQNPIVVTAPPNGNGSGGQNSGGAPSDVVTNDELIDDGQARRNYRVVRQRTQGRVAPAAVLPPIYGR